VITPGFNNRGSTLAIKQHLAGSGFDTDTVRIMVDAYEAVRGTLKLPGGDTPINSKIADRVIQMVRDGERDADVVSKRVLLWMGRQ
jgi:hypothetical protein